MELRGFNSVPTYRYDLAAHPWVPLARMPGLQQELAAAPGGNGYIYVAAGDTVDWWKPNPGG